MEALAKILPKMKKFDAYINDVKKDNPQMHLQTADKLQSLHLV